MKDSKWIISIFLSLLFVLPGSRLASAQLCPGDSTIFGTLNPDSSLSQPIRTTRNGIPSECEPPKVYPGTLIEDGIFNTHTFGSVFADSCITVNFDVGTCGPNVFAVAYLNEYDPGDQSLNYLGDLGSSDTQSFSFEVPGGNNFVIVAESANVISTCDYSFTIDFFPCEARLVPTLNETGLIILGALMLLAIVYALRKRARASA